MSPRRFGQRPAVCGSLKKTAQVMHMGISQVIACDLGTGRIPVLPGPAWPSVSPGRCRGRTWEVGLYCGCPVGNLSSWNFRRLYHDGWSPVAAVLTGFSFQEKKIFQIPWMHAARHGWDVEKDAPLFRNWAIHTGIDDPHCVCVGGGALSFSCFLFSCSCGIIDQ